MFLPLPEPPICCLTHFVAEVLCLITSVNFAITHYCVKDVYHQHIFVGGLSNRDTSYEPTLNCDRHKRCQGNDRDQQENKKSPIIQVRSPSSIIYSNPYRVSLSSKYTESWGGELERSTQYILENTMRSSGAIDIVCVLSLFPSPQGSGTSQDLEQYIINFNKTCVWYIRKLF